ncbi:MAG: hypothetical protein L0387_10600 [Acidobacteria bacterium]|nr:hypothetical protein [Acidobacteriota bacterium]
MKRYLILTATFFGLLLASAGCNADRTNSMNTNSTNMQFALGPGAASPIASGELACQSVAHSALVEKQLGGNVLEATVGTAREKIALNVRGQELKFMTAASIEAGSAEASVFQIIRNDKESLAAMHFGEGWLGYNLNSFVLDKETGFAVWTKSHPRFMGLGKPDVWTYYLACRDS